MKIAFLHYHLKPGGVTTVIKQQIAAVKDDCEILVISGETPEDDFHFKTAVIPEIGYDQLGMTRETPKKTAQKILTAISDLWPAGCDILHVHNPLLAKNLLFLDILSALSQNNIRLLLQIHDFAEDGRPGVYYADALYPSNCHFCVINSRDLNILLKSGLQSPGLHLLPNMVTPFQIEPEKQPGMNFVLYPVRAIRRKNIGEAILLSLFFRNHETLAITRAPNSPYDWKHYTFWKRFSAENKLSVLFEASNIYAFTDLVKYAKSMITTSISEGFGFSYLEPWTAGQMVSGRCIPDICFDFTQKGMLLDHLYHKIDIPLDAIDLDLFYKKWKSCILDNALQFGVFFSNDEISRAYEIMTAGHHIDFAILDESFQKQVMIKILSDKNFKDQVIRLNPFLSSLLGTMDNKETIRHNRFIVETEFSQAAYRNQLLSAWQKVIHTPVNHWIDKQILAKEFLTLENFSLLKWVNEHV